MAVKKKTTLKGCLQKTNMSGTGNGEKAGPTDSERLGYETLFQHSRVAKVVFFHG
jgi:hypothetical protein